MSKRGMEKRVTFRMAEERFRLLEDVAEREGFSVSLVIRSLVYRYLEDLKRFRPTKNA
ncbi:MAG: hypothetical protein NUW09_05160 [Deltaproteobacteria bacterium]|nr:hypothetical protein [Deltaproteobacteria bacterium]